MFKYRRVSAFIIDTLIVTFVSVLLTMNPKINKAYGMDEEYNKAYLDKQSSISYNYSLDTNETIDELYNSIGQELYDVTKVQGYSLVIYLVTNTLYFTLFTFFNGGKTVGCAIFKLKILKRNGNKANILNLAMRSLFMGSTLIYKFPIMAIFMLVIPRVLSVRAAFLPIVYSTMLSIMFEIALLIVFLVNKSNMTIQDYMSNTKIIDTKE